MEYIIAFLAFAAFVFFIYTRVQKRRARRNDIGGGAVNPDTNPAPDGPSFDPTDRR